MKYFLPKIRNKAKMSRLDPSVKKINEFIKITKEQVRLSSFTDDTNCMQKIPKMLQQNTRTNKHVKLQDMKNVPIITIQLLLIKQPCTVKPFLLSEHFLPLHN